MKSTTPPNTEPAVDPNWSDWFAAAAQPEIDLALRDLYARLDADVAARSPTCWQSGKCCHFDTYGHRLYVTALEVAWFLQRVCTGVNNPPDVDARGGVRVPLPLAGQLSVDPSGSCPYQRDNLCTAHPIRPLGCRVFFCQEGTQQWQSELYEGYLGDLRALHDKHALPYRYLEWLAGIHEASAWQHGA